MKILPNISLCCAYKKTVLPVFCLLCFTFPVFAQGDITFMRDDIIGIDMSVQLGATRTSSDVLNCGVLGVGARTGYYLGSIVFLDGEILHEPGKFSECGTKKTAVLGGFRFGTIFDNKYGIFAKARAGALWLNPIEDMELIPETDNSGVIHRGKGKFRVVYGNEVYPVVDIGVIVERYFELNRGGKKFFVRFDIGDWVIPFGNKEAHSIYGDSYRAGTTHNLATEFGLGFRF